MEKKSRMEAAEIKLQETEARVRKVNTELQELNANWLKNERGAS